MTTMMRKIIPFSVPNNLRKKYVSSKVSREIFFIDCINDLNYCANSNLSYDLIRSSVLLRMLLLDGGLETISNEYNLSISLKANENEIQGIPFTKKEVRKIKEITSDNQIFVGPIKTIQLMHSPLKTYPLENFANKICLKIIGVKEYNFSVSNIIEILANKHGAAHLESTFDSSTLDSFHLGDYSPFSITDGNFFLKKIKEIISILIEAIYPLLMAIQKELMQYNSHNSQAGTSATFKVIKTKEEYDQLILKKQ